MQDWLRQAMDDGANQQHGLVVVAEDRPEYVIDHRPDHVSLHVGGARRVRHVMTRYVDVDAFASATRVSHNDSEGRRLSSSCSLAAGTHKLALLSSSVHSNVTQATTQLRIVIV